MSKEGEGGTCDKEEEFGDGGGGVGWRGHVQRGGGGHLYDNIEC